MIFSYPPSIRSHRLRPSSPLCRTTTKPLHELPTGHGRRHTAPHPCTSGSSQNSNQRLVPGHVVCPPHARSQSKVKEYLHEPLPSPIGTSSVTGGNSSAAFAISAKVLANSSKPLLAGIMMLLIRSPWASVMRRSLPR